MSPELDKELVSKYPKIFADRYGNMYETAMCWGFEVGDGWATLIDDLCAKIQAVCDVQGVQIKATQVKEKFGTLRFYTDIGCDEIWNIIDDAERISGITCEVCGKLGKTNGINWLKTTCSEHEK